MKPNCLSLLGFILPATLGVALSQTLVHAPPSPMAGAAAGESTKVQGTITDRDGDKVTLV